MCVKMSVNSRGPWKMWRLLRRGGIVNNGKFRWIKKWAHKANDDIVSLELEDIGVFKYARDTAANLRLNRSTTVSDSNI